MSVRRKLFFLMENETLGTEKQSSSTVPCGGRWIFGTTSTNVNRESQNGYANGLF